MSIKPWQERINEAAYFSIEDYENDKASFMQAEIDELRKENACLKAELGDLPQAQAEMLSECKRLRDAMKQANDQAEKFERLWYLRGDALEVARTALAIEAARAALREKS